MPSSVPDDPADRIRQILREQEFGPKPRSRRGDVLLAAGFALVVLLLHSTVLGGRPPVPDVPARTLYEEALGLARETDALLYRPDPPLEEYHRQLHRSRLLTEETARRDPSNALPPALLGCLWMDSGWPDKAEALWRKSLALQIDLPSCRLDLARFLLQPPVFPHPDGGIDHATHNRRMEAADLLQNLAFSKPHLLRLAEALRAYAEGDLLSTQRICRSWIERAPDERGSEEFWRLLALTLPPDEQIPPLDHALKICPGFVLALVDRGTAHHELGNTAEALRDYGRALEIQPRLIRPRVNRARLRQSCGDKEGAWEDFTEALRILPPSSPDRPRVERLRDDLK